MEIILINLSLYLNFKNLLHISKWALPSTGIDINRALPSSEHWHQLSIAINWSVWGSLMQFLPTLVLILKPSFKWPSSSTYSPSTSSNTPIITSSSSSIQSQNQQSYTQTNDNSGSYTIQASATSSPVMITPQNIPNPTCGSN